MTTPSDHLHDIVTKYAIMTMLVVVGPACSSRWWGDGPAVWWLDLIYTCL